MLARVSGLNPNLPLLVILGILASLLTGLVAVRFSGAVTALLEEIPTFPPIFFAAFIPVALLALGWVVLNPKAGLVLMIIALPLQRSIFGYPGLVLSWIPVAVLAAYCYFSFTVGRTRINLRANLPQLLAVIFFGYTVLSLLAHLGEEQGAVFYKYSIPAVLMFIVLGIIIKDRGQLNRAVYWLMGLAAVVALLGLLERVSPYAYSWYIYDYFWHGHGELIPIEFSHARERINSVFYDANHLANFLVTSLLICTPFLLSRWTSRRFLTLAAVSLVLTGIYFTFSVGNWIALGVGLVTLWLLSSANVKARVVPVILLIGLVLLFVSAYGIAARGLIPESTRARFIALGGVTGGLGELEQGPLGARASLVHAGLDMFGENPLFGTGMGSYMVLAPQTGHLGGLPAETAAAPYSHNSYAVILAELGIVGMLLLGLCIASVIVTGVRNIRKTRDNRLRYLQSGTLAAILANLLFLLSYGSIMYNLNLWFAMGLTLAIKGVVQGEIEASASENQDG